MKKFVTTFIFLLLIPWQAIAAQVVRIDISGLTSINENIVRGVIAINPGDEYNPNIVKDAEDNLKSWGVFESINVKTSWEGLGAVLHFILKEAVVVASIDISGNYPYLENKIRKNLTLHPGNVLTQDIVDEQVERIKSFYAREGFVETDVYVDQEDIPAFGGVVLTFNVKRGTSIHYRKIEVIGNHAFPKGRFISVINPYIQFSERRLANSLRKMKEFYQRNSYPRARIKIKEKHIDYDAKKVDITLEVSEGPRVEVVFKGATHIDKKLLRDRITIINHGSLDQYEMDESVTSLEDFIKERGFPDVKVEAKKTERKDGTAVITFTIEKNALRWIRWLNFEGNKEVSSSELAEEMQNRPQRSGKFGIFFPDAIPDDNVAILKALRKKGFLNAKIGEWDIRHGPQGYALRITIPIEEGPQTVVKEMIFNGNKTFTIPKLLHELKNKPGQPFNETILENEKQLLTTFYADNGYPYANIRQKYTIETSSQTANITYDIDEGPEVHIGQILIIGDVMTSQKAIKNAMDIHEGDLFSYRKIIDSELNIRRLGPFAAVKIETLGLEDRDKIIHLKVSVEEQRPFVVDLSVGYATYEHFTSTFSFTNLNAFGWAKTNSLKLTGGQKLSSAEISWVDPRFLSSSFEMSALGWIQYKQRPAYAFTQIAGSIGWFRRFRRLGITFRVEPDRNYFVQGDSVAADADSLRNNTIIQTATSVSFDSRNSFSNPSKGFYTLGAVNFYDEVQGSGANFVKLTWRGENDQGFWDRLILSTAMRFDRIQDIGTNVSVPTNELLFLGGTDTLRGFTEDSLGPVNAAGRATGGRTRWILNEELRIQLFSAFNGVIFYDMGSLTNTFDQIIPSVIRKSIGVGLRYITPVGPIRADYGFKIDRKPGESIGHFHFTFGYVF